MFMKPAFFIFLVVGLLSSTAQAQQFKIATLAPEGTPWMQEMRRASDEIERRTAGRVAFKFYPGGIMGNEKSVLRKIRIGQLQGAALTSGGLARIYPENQIYSLPMIFNSYAEVDYVRQRMDAKIIEGLKKNGYAAFGLAEGGFSYLMSNQPIRNLNDIRNQKIWIPEGDVVATALMEVFGLTPVPLPLTDVLTGLQTGLISTIGSTTSFSIALQWHTKVKYLIDLPLFYSYGAFVISDQAYRKLGREDQVIVRDTLETVFIKLNRQNRLDNQNAKEALRKLGIEFLVPAEEDKAELYRAAEKATRQLNGKGVYNTGMLETLNDYLRTQRNNKAAIAVR